MRRCTGHKVTKGLEHDRSEKRCRTAFATAVQIRPRYDMAFGKIPETTCGGAFFGVKIGFVFELIISDKHGLSGWFNAG